MRDYRSVAQANKLAIGTKRSICGHAKSQHRFEGAAASARSVQNC